MSPLGRMIDIVDHDELVDSMVTVNCQTIVNKFSVVNGVGQQPKVRGNHKQKMQ